MSLGDEVKLRLEVSGVNEASISSSRVRSLVSVAGDHRDAEWCIEQYLEWRVSQTPTEDFPEGLFTEPVEQRVRGIVRLLAPHVTTLDCLVLWTRWRWQLATKVCAWPFGEECVGVMAASPSKPESVKAHAFNSTQKGLDGIDIDSIVRELQRALGIDVTSGEFLFHGTSHVNAASIAERGVDLACCRNKCDFGRGLYLRDNLHDAIAWACKTTQMVGHLPAVLIYSWGRARSDPAVFTFVDGPDALWADFINLNHDRSSVSREREDELLDRVGRSVMVVGPVSGDETQLQYALVDSRECKVWKQHLIAVVFLSG